MQKQLKVLFNIFSILYPIGVFLCLVILKLPIRIFVLFLLVLLLFFLGTSATVRRRDKQKSMGKTILVSSLILLVLIGSFVANSSIFIRIYPVFVNISFLYTFITSLFQEESIIYRFATLAQPSIRSSITRDKVKAYCRKVTIVWCTFFILNGTVSLLTALLASDRIWAIYTGLISYILMGALFAGEFIVRVIVQQGMEKEVPLSKVQENSRHKDTVLCYQGSWSQKQYKTWGDFIQDTARLRHYIRQSPNDKWLLHCEDTWFFLVAYAALLQCGKTVMLTANVSPIFLKEIRGENTPFLTDQNLPYTTSIAEVLQNEAATTQNELNPPAINPDDTKIILYTSGSTGHPKAVVQRLTEFEQDNRFILSQWGNQLIERKLCTTVSHHHIYGLLFSIMLPFTAGIPFRRRRVEHPEEFLSLDNTAYTIIAVPAFLKRANQDSPCYNLVNPWIFTSGGVLTPEEGLRTSQTFGFWPIEVYGSTETSGIAWRCSRDGIAWTPFQNAEITLAENGCLKVRSPYIKDPEGFVTGDLAEILQDGRFILQGRADSIVKIEEKRISTTELENRLLQSGLVQDAVVIPLQEPHRQSLGAALVLNEAGQERFRSSTKLEMNNFFKEYLRDFFEQVVIPRKWRFPDTIPLDTQGKKSREAIVALFSQQQEFHVHSMETETNGATVIFSVPATSVYFDGHFPSFPILPAVAQVTIALKLAKQYLGITAIPCGIRKMKFSNMIMPEQRIRLTMKISDDGKNLSIKMENPSNPKQVHSQGTIKTGEE